MIPLASEPISIIPQVTPPVPLTASQRAKMVAIEAAIGLLNEARVSFTLFGSPDEAITPDMKVIHGQRLSYAAEVETIRRETPLARQAVLEAAMRVLSTGMLGGGLAAYGSDGRPLCVWSDGKAMVVKQVPKEPQVTA